MTQCELKRQTKLSPIGNTGQIGDLSYGGANQFSRIADFLYSDATIYLQRKLDKVRPYLSPETIVHPLPALQLPLIENC
jgi:hypothetical protein